MKQTLLLLLVILCAAAPGPAATPAKLSGLLQTLRAVGPEGRGNALAAEAWKTIAAADGASLSAILGAMDGANDLAVNWLRAAVDTIAGRELAAGRALPAAALEKFVRDTKHHPRARRLAYELVARVEPDKARQLITGLLDDPSTELRRDAVQGLTDEAAALSKAGKTNDAVVKFQAALKSARDVDQVESLAKTLNELGHPVELSAVFGWVKQWKVIGPFDSTRGAGFEKVYPPEQNLDLARELDGKSAKIRWQDYQATGDYGKVDLNKPCGALKEVAGYAYTEFHSERRRPVELRLGCKNAWKVWLNGKFLFGRDEYHRGMEIDQYRLAAELQPGKNTILVKLCQNEQKEAWTVEWEFQLRVTDALGTPIAFCKP